MTAEQGDHTRCHCHYHPDLIVVRRGEEGPVISNLGLEENRILDGGGLCRYLDGLDQSDIGPIVERIAVIKVDDDAHQVANDLGLAGIEASPVHGVGYMGHSGFRGDRFAPVDRSHPEVPPGEGPVIAMVDSGLAPDEDVPSWLNESVECERPQDTEILTQKHPVSHGTFVASVIRRVAPDHRLSLASARPDPGFLKSSEDDHVAGTAPQPTDELNVFGAIVRLVERHREDKVDALNLSLGAHECPDGGVFLLAMRIALEYWQENFDGCQIFAAGGNSDCEEPLYPAAWSDLGIRAVGAATDGGDTIVWRNGSDVPAPDRNWINDWAPGQHIGGLSGVSPDDVIAWSGSSFACAVAAAASVHGVHSTTAGPETWWTDQSVDYRSIPGLLF